MTDGYGGGRSFSRGDFDLEGLLAGVQKFQQDVAGSSQRMALQIADAWSKDRLVRVWVNAQGVVIDVEVDQDEFKTATAEDVAAAVVEAAQSAASKMRLAVAAFQSDLRERLSGLLPSDGTPLGEVDALRSLQPDVPTSRPGSPERRAGAAALSAPDGDESDGESGGWDVTLRG